MLAAHQLVGNLLFAAEGLSFSDSMTLLVQHLVAAVVFAVVGIAVLAVSFWIMEKVTPFSIVKEIEEDHNVALAIIVGAIVVGVSVIIAAAILG